MTGRAGGSGGGSQRRAGRGSVWGSLVEGRGRVCIFVVD